MTKSFIKIICLTRDEHELIEDWLLYHGYLVGYDNIILMDNNSVHPEVLRIYEEYRKKGVTIHTVEDFGGLGQGVHTTNYINMYKHTCDWFVPLDTDEFLYSAKHLHEGSDPTDRDNVIEVFKAIPLDQTWCTIQEFPQAEVDTANPNYIENRIIKPARNMIYFAKDTSKSAANHWYDGCIKSFVRSDAFIKISNGNHIIDVSYGNRGVAPVGFFHFHSTGNRDLFNRAKKHIVSHKYVNVNDTLKNIVNTCVKIEGYSHHRIWQYTHFITREFIVRLFIQHLNRLPTIIELDNTTKLYMNNHSSVIESYIQSLAQNAHDISNDLCEIKDNDIYALVFNESPLDMQNIHTYSCLKNRLLSLGV